MPAIVITPNTPGFDKLALAVAAATGVASPESNTQVKDHVALLVQQFVQTWERNAALSAVATPTPITIT